MALSHQVAPLFLWNESFSMTKATIYIFGIGGHAKVIADSVMSGTEYKLAGFVDIKVGDDLLGAPVLSEEDFLSEAKSGQHVILAIGSNHLRKNIAQQIALRRPDIKFGIVIHPSAIVSSHAAMGVGSYIGAGSVVNIDTNIGSHVIINSSAVIEHDCKIADYASVSPGAVLGGSVVLGSSSYIGIGAKVIQGISIGKETLIASGALLNKDAEDNLIYMGIPARKSGARQGNDAVY